MLFYMFIYIFIQIFLSGGDVTVKTFMSEKKEEIWLKYLKIYIFYSILSFNNQYASM